MNHHLRLAPFSPLIALCAAALPLLGGCDANLPPEGETTAAECSDGRDNDGDGAIDCDDLACGVHSFCAGMTPDAGYRPDAGAPPVRACDSDNCDGCCSGDTCLGGNSASACGAAGRACLDCGPGHLCRSGACVIDSASRWDLIVESATVHAQTASGEAWDAFGGAPDPFINIYVGGETMLAGRTPTADDTFEATFDTRIPNQRADALRAFLSFQAIDEDATSDDIIGHCFVELGDLEFDGATRRMECPRAPSENQAGFTLRWRLERN